MTHEMTLPPAAFEPLLTGIQTALVAPTTPALRIGDHLTVRELLPHRNEFTDRAATFRIAHLAESAGIAYGFALASLAKVAIATTAPAIDVDGAPPRDAKPRGWIVAGEVLDATPAAITVMDQHGERHVLTGAAWTPEAQPTDSVILEMTAEGFRLRVINRQCVTPAHELDPQTQRCAHCGLSASAIEILRQPVPF